MLRCENFAGLLANGCGGGYFDHLWHIKFVTVATAAIRAKTSDLRVKSHNKLTDNRYILQPPVFSEISAVATVTAYAPQGGAQLNRLSTIATALATQLKAKAQ